MRIVKLPLIAIVVLSVSCDPSPQPQTGWGESLEDLASLHCRAIELRKNRFALADSIRSASDSMMRLTDENMELKAELETRMDAFEKRKEILAEESQSLADTIREHLNRSTRQMSPEEKRSFNDSLESRSVDLGCIDRTDTEN